MAVQNERSSGQWFWAGFFATLGGVFALFLLSLIPGLLLLMLFTLGSLGTTVGNSHIDLDTVIGFLGTVMGLGIVGVLSYVAHQWYQRRD